MEFKDTQSIYLQIADLFCENILLKKWKPGDRIPSVREMAVNIEVNPNTVMRTFKVSSSIKEGLDISYRKMVFKRQRHSGKKNL